MFSRGGEAISVEQGCSSGTQNVDIKSPKNRLARYWRNIEFPQEESLHDKPPLPPEVYLEGVFMVYCLKFVVCWNALK